ncbi:MAG: hypothetical protein AABZ55_15580, partial [Bdellovibrionota bacterium]
MLPQADDLRLQAVWTASAPMRPLRAWSRDDLTRFKPVFAKERDPFTGQIVRWKGVLVSDIIDKALESLPGEQRALVDLIVFRNAEGAVATVPRSLVIKYPVLLAYEREGHALAADTATYGSFFPVMPWSSKVGILNEELPLEKFIVPKLNQIELANYRERYPSLFLKRRTNPVAMRGEKLFVRNCVSCHAPSDPSRASFVEFFNGTKARVVASNFHPDIKGGLPKLNDLNRRSIESYFEAYQNEKGLETH